MFKLTREVGKTNLKKFLTKRNGCDKITKLSSRGGGKRSLKIEQQKQRENKESR